MRGGRRRRFGRMGGLPSRPTCQYRLSGLLKVPGDGSHTTERGVSGACGASQARAAHGDTSYRLRQDVQCLLAHISPFACQASTALGAPSAAPPKSHPKGGLGAAAPPACKRSFRHPNLITVHRRTSWLRNVRGGERGAATACRAAAASWRSWLASAWCNMLPHKVGSRGVDARRGLPADWPVPAAGAACRGATRARGRCAGRSGARQPPSLAPAGRWRYCGGAARWNPHAAAGLPPAPQAPASARLAPFRPRGRATWTARTM